MIHTQEIGFQIANVLILLKMVTDQMETNAGNVTNVKRVFN